MNEQTKERKDLMAIGRECIFAAAAADGAVFNPSTEHSAETL